MFNEGYSLNKGLSDFARPQMFHKEEDRHHRYLSPMEAESLAFLPPTLIATSNFDMLRGQGRALAERMKTDGCQAAYINYMTLMHGFLQHTKVNGDALAAATETAQLYGQLIRGTYRGNYC